MESQFRADRGDSNRQNFVVSADSDYGIQGWGTISLRIPLSSIGQRKRELGIAFLLLVGIPFFWVFARRINEAEKLALFQTGGSHAVSERR